MRPTDSSINCGASSRPRRRTTSLQNLVSQLRKLLGPDLLVTRPPGYVAPGRARRVDLGALRTARRGGARCGASEERAAKLREALALWRGSPLADLAFETFAQTEIRRLEELRRRGARGSDRRRPRARCGGASSSPELEALVDAPPAAGAASRAADARALPLRPSGRGARRLPRGSPRPRRRARDRSGPGAPAALRVDPPPGVGCSPRRPTLRDRSRITTPTSSKALLAGRLVPGPRDGREPRHGATLRASTRSPRYLADSLRLSAERTETSARVSEYVALMKGVGPLYDELHELLRPRLRRRPCPPRARGACGGDRRAERSPSADRDDELRPRARACIRRGRGKARRRFVHLARTTPRQVSSTSPPRARSPSSTCRTRTPVSRSTTRTVSSAPRPGRPSSPEREWESFVVTEDDHIDYLAQAGHRQPRAGHARRPSPA